MEAENLKSNTVRVIEGARFLFLFAISPTGLGHFNFFPSSSRSFSAATIELVYATVLPKLKIQQSLTTYLWTSAIWRLLSRRPSSLSITANWSNTSAISAPGQVQRKTACIKINDDWMYNSHFTSHMITGTFAKTAEAVHLKVQRWHFLVKVMQHLLPNFAPDVFKGMQCNTEAAALLA